MVKLRSNEGYTPHPAWFYITISIVLGVLIAILFVSDSYKPR